jgi:23S rRNA (guanosine2251-2'-O)-methyltransferase
MAVDIIYGRQPVSETLKAGRRDFKRLLLAGNCQDAEVIRTIREAAQRQVVRVETVDLQTLDTLTQRGNHQGVAVEAGPYPYCEFEECLEEAGKPPLFLLLDHLQDPQNLGALLRVADAAGVDAVFLPKDRAAEVTPAAIRASAGAAEHLRICRVVNLHQTMGKLKEAGIWLAGLDQTPAATLYTATDLKGPLGLVVGSEGEGMGRLIRETCDYVITLPMRGHVGSLNASVAGAVALYEILRQRG